MLPDKLHLKLGMRHFSGSLRTLKTIQGKVDFASNDYLGFSKLLSVAQSSQNGSTGSRLISGNTRLHEQVEQQVAGFHNTESALLFNSGYDANLGLIAAVTDRFDLIIYDEYVHASIRDGISLSHAKAIKYRHNDLNHLSILLDKFREDEDMEVYVVTESVFSMDGDQPDLIGIVDLVHKFENVHLILDEAHALGVIGKKGAGLAQKLGVESAIFARVVTFGKGLGAHGAAVVGSEDLRNYLINFCRSFIYTTALPEHCLRVIEAGYSALENSQKEVVQLQENIRYFNECVINSGLRLRFRESRTAIQICIIPNNDQVKKTAVSLQQNGYDIRAILSPTVPQGQERLRICLHSYNSKDEIKNMLTLLEKLLND
jgi:8-amino-7-oxononanoate synthase